MALGLLPLLGSFAVLMAVLHSLYSPSAEGVGIVEAGDHVLFRGLRRCRRSCCLLFSSGIKDSARDGLPLLLCPSSHVLHHYSPSPSTPCSSVSWKSSRWSKSISSNLHFRTTLSFTRQPSRTRPKQLSPTRRPHLFLDKSSRSPQNPSRNPVQLQSLHQKLLPPCHRPLPPQILRPLKSAVRIRWHIAGGAFELTDLGF